METHRIETTVQPNRTILLEDLPFEEGEIVEIVVSEVRNRKKTSENLYPLRGTPYKYDDPFEPAVSLEDWDALK